MHFISKSNLSTQLQCTTWRLESFHDQVLGIRQLFTRATPPEPSLNVEDFFDVKSFLSSCASQQSEFVVRSKRSSTFRFFRRYRALHFPFSRRLRRRNRPPSDLKQTPNHDAFLPPETWRKRLLLAVQSRCAAFQPSATWRTQNLRAFQHASGKFRRGAALGPAVSWKRSTMRTDVMAFPWRCRRPSMRALTM